MSDHSLLGNLWEAFYIQGYQVGVLHRTTTFVTDFPTVLMSKLQVVLTVAGELTGYEHVYYFTTGLAFHPIRICLMPGREHQSMCALWRIR